MSELQRYGKLLGMSDDVLHNRTGACSVESRQSSTTDKPKIKEDAPYPSKAPKAKAGTAFAKSCLQGVFSKPALSCTKKEVDNGCEVLINVPDGVEGLDDVEILFDSTSLEISIPGHKRCIVKFPRVVNKGAITAKFKKKKRAIKIKAPYSL